MLFTSPKNRTRGIWLDSSQINVFMVCGKHFLFLFFTNIMGWLPWVITESTSLKPYTIRSCWLRKIWWKVGGGGADNPAGGLCHLQAWNPCWLGAFTRGTWPWRMASGLATGANKIQRHNQHPNTRLCTTPHLSLTACFLLNLLKKWWALGGYLSRVICPVIPQGFIHLKKLLMACHKEEMTFTCSVPFAYKIGMHQTHCRPITTEQ